MGFARLAHLTPAVLTLVTATALARDDDKDILPNHLLHYRDYIWLVFGEA